jgi:hypothetical protein
LHACFGRGGVFVFSAAVNVKVLHRDFGIGDGFDCPLPNGYALSFIDTTDAGTVYNPKDRPVWSEVREDAVNDVTMMQLAGPYILGGVDSQRLEHWEQDLTVADSWFLLNTKTGERRDFKTLDGLRESARRTNITLNLSRHQPSAKCAGNRKSASARTDDWSWSCTGKIDRAMLSPASLPSPRTRQKSGRQ